MLKYQGVHGKNKGESSEGEICAESHGMGRLKSIQRMPWFASHRFDVRHVSWRYLTLHIPVQHMFHWSLRFAISNLDPPEYSRKLVNVAKLLLYQSYFERIWFQFQGTWFPKANGPSIYHHFWGYLEGLGYQV